MQRRYIFKKTLDTRRWSLRVLAMFLLASIGILLTGQLSATPPAAFPLKFKVSASRMSSTPPAVTSSTNRIQRFSRFWRERRVARENKERNFAMNVVLSGKTIAIAADEVTADGDRIPLTNFQKWSVDADDDETERLAKFEALLENRHLTAREKLSIMMQVNDVLRLLRGKPTVEEACETLTGMQENIQIRDGGEIRRQAAAESNNEEVATVKEAHASVRS